LLDSSERAAVTGAVAKVEAAMKGEDREAIEQAVESLEHATLSFAERRMDRGIRKALAGHKLAEFEEPGGEDATKDRAAR